MQAQYITEKEASQITCIPLQTLRNHRFCRKGIKYAKIGRSVRYDIKDVLDFMEKHKVRVDGDN